MIENIFKLKLNEVLTSAQDGLQIRLSFLGRDSVSLTIVTPNGVHLTHLTAEKTKQINMNPVNRDLCFEYLNCPRLNDWQTKFLRDLIAKDNGYRLTEKQTEFFNRIGYKASIKHDQTRRRRTA